MKLIQCYNANDILQVMKIGNSNKVIAATRMNQFSSRSHCLLRIFLEQENPITGQITKSKMWIVDLAGSEKVSKTETEGLLLEQANSINQSLSTLGRVIRHLVENQSHVPYRESKVTRLLQESLGGNAKTVLIICMSMSIYNVEETLSTIRFGCSAKLVKNQARINKEIGYKELLRLYEAALKTIEELRTGKDQNIVDLMKRIAELEAENALLKMENA